jgi:hypothetical protein
VWARGSGDEGQRRHLDARLGILAAACAIASVIGSLAGTVLSTSRQGEQMREQDTRQAAAARAEDQRQFLFDQRQAAYKSLFTAKSFVDKSYFDIVAHLLGLDRPPSRIGEPSAIP